MEEEYKSRYAPKLDLTVAQVEDLLYGLQIAQNNVSQFSGKKFAHLQQEISSQTDIPCPEIF